MYIFFLCVSVCVIFIQFFSIYEVLLIECFVIYIYISIRYVLLQIRTVTSWRKDSELLSHTSGHIKSITALIFSGYLPLLHALLAETYLTFDIMLIYTKRDLSYFSYSTFIIVVFF